MAYKLLQFDGLLLPDLMDTSGGDDMSGGEAQQSYTQLPGGGWIDNYRALDSPQGIRPITRNAILAADTNAELVEKLKALRGKIGRRGKLSIQFETGELWWQWARCERVHTPRGIDALCLWLPCNLSFTTAAQHWYGIIQSGDTWSVGDDSFYLGDGTAEVGMNDYFYELDTGTDTITPTLPNEGNMDARNLLITLQTDTRLDTISIRNETNGQHLLWTNPNITGAFTLIIDTGSKSVLTRRDSSSLSITEIKRRGAHVLVTRASHGRTTGDSIEITGTGIYDGIHHDLTVLDSSNFTYVVDDPVHQETETLSTGTFYPVFDAWSGLTVYDKTNWFLLSPGDNELTVTHTVDAGTPVQEYNIHFRWYYHYK